MGDIEEKGYLKYPGKTPTRYEILDILSAANGQFLSGNELARLQDISRTAVWKNIQTLIGEGFSIEAANKKGYRLMGMADVISPPKIMARLNTTRLGRTILYVPRTSSTNYDAKLLADFVEDGTLLIAETQTGGKGRLGRRWESPLGGIFMSLVLKPYIDPSRVPGLALITGYSIARTLGNIYCIPTKVKWPNDVLVNGRKIAGILCEMRAELDAVSHVIVGVGINANVEISLLPEEIKHKSSSLKEELGQSVDRNSLVASILNDFEPLYSEFLDRGLQAFQPRLEEMLAYRGQPVIVENVTLGSKTFWKGTLHGLDSEGRLVLSGPEYGKKAFPSGDLSLRIETKEKE